MNKIDKVFKAKKPTIAMLHIGYLLGQEKFPGLDVLISSAIADVNALQDNGVDGLLLENWMEDSIGEFVSPETLASLAVVTHEVAKHIRIPFGINVLNNDYKAALSLAKLTGASFIQLDAFVDNVVSDFVHSPIASKNPFRISPNPTAIHDYAKQIGAQDIPIFAFIQPKHYKLLDPKKNIEQSAKEAVAAGASALLVTKATGSAPTLDLIRRAKSAAGDIPVGIGSGFSTENAREFLPEVDFAVIGTALKVDANTDNPVDSKRVKELMQLVKSLRKT